MEGKITCEEPLFRRIHTCLIAGLKEDLEELGPSTQSQRSPHVLPIELVQLVLKLCITQLSR